MVAIDLNRKLSRSQLTTVQIADDISKKDRLARLYGQVRFRLDASEEVALGNMSDVSQD